LTALDHLVHTSGDSKCAHSSLIYNIELLKHNFKSSYDLKASAEQILSLDYIQTLINNFLEKTDNSSNRNETPTHLPRNYESFNAKQVRLENIRTEDNHYKNLVKQEATHVENAKYWHKVLYEKIPEMQEQLEK
jgi:cell shape-determining protein MreC